MTPKPLKIEKIMLIDYRLLNPLGFHLLRLMQDKSIRNIIMYGGSSSGKTYSMAQIVLIFTMWEGSNHLVMRKVGAAIKDTVYQDFKTAAEQLGVSSRFKFSDGVKTITCVTNDARIVFKGLDDPEKIKGLSSFKRVILDEWSEFEEADYKQIRLRLRGMEGQQIITTFNPIKETHWIKKNVFDRQKWHDVPMTVELDGVPMPEVLTQVKSIRMNDPRFILHKRTGELIEHAPDTVVIQTTFMNNFWVTGSPDGKYGYYDDQCIATFEFDRDNDPDYYNVYALGEWGVIRSGSEFFGSFNRGRHTAECKFNPALAVHVSVDNNVLPYISYSLWQIEYTDRTTIRQIDEIAAESPDNTARKSAILLARRLRSKGVDRIYLHGDASTRNASTIDDLKRSFLDLVISTLQSEGVEVIDCVGVKNPSVSMTGEFINAIFDGIIPDIDIVIGEHCNISIEDYMSVQKDANGSILKTKVKNKTTMQTYEEHGHLSDTFRYAVADLVREQFLSFSNRRKRNTYARDGMINFYNPDTVCQYSREVLYCMPNVNGKFALVHGKLCGDRWHIADLMLKDTSSTDEMTGILAAMKSPLTVVECAPAYFRFVRELRKEIPNVRALVEVADVGRRIAATSDFVKNHLLFNETAANEDAGYSLFLSNLLDYNRTSGDSIEASAALSGFVQFVVKFDFLAK